MRECWVVHLGRIDYDDCHRLQKDLVARREKKEVPDVLLLLEHEPVITCGRHGEKLESYLKIPKEELENQGIKVRAVERGGHATYHGPGQLIAYPIMLLKGRNQIRRAGEFMDELERVACNALAEYLPKKYLAISPDNKFGVWWRKDKEYKKLVSSGVKIEPSGVSWHGIAINLNTDLSYFDYIKPCGFPSEVMTSIKELTGKAVDVEKFSKKFTGHFARHFSLSPTFLPTSRLPAEI